MKRYLALIASIFISATAYGQSMLSTSVWDEAAYGSLPGVASVLINGNNGGITTTFEPIWPESAAYTPLAAAMSAPYCASSDNTNDKAAGTGCLTMNVSGVTSAYVPFSETITLNGQTSVVMANTTALFINSMTCLTAGSTFANTGTIRCGTGTNTAGVPAVAHSHMAIGAGKTQSFMYAVPANKTMLCRNLTASSYDATISRTAQFVIDRYVDPVAGKVLTREFYPVFTNTQLASASYPGVIRFAPKTVFMLQALSAASTGPIMASAECILIDLATSNTNQVVF